MFPETEGVAFVGVPLSVAPLRLIRAVHELVTVALLFLTVTVAQ
jgi:hypothetical protein